MRLPFPCGFELAKLALSKLDLILYTLREE